MVMKLSRVTPNGRFVAITLTWVPRSFLKFLFPHVRASPQTRREADAKFMEVGVKLGVEGDGKLMVAGAVYGRRVTIVYRVPESTLASEPLLWCNWSPSEARLDKPLFATTGARGHVDRINFNEWGWVKLTPEEKREAIYTLEKALRAECAGMPARYWLSYRERGVFIILLEDAGVRYKIWGRGVIELEVDE